MPSCEYCDDEFEDEEAYLQHLDSEHYDDLDRIDRRRVDDATQADSGSNVGVMAAVGVVVLLVAGGGAYALLGGGGGGGADLPPVEQRPGQVGSAHYHGSITVQIDDRQFDFSQGQFQHQDDYFHFEGGDGSQWHAHANGVTLQYGLNTLGIGVTEDRVVWNGNAYDDGDEGTSVSITVNGEPVDPASYVLEEGDEVQVLVTTGG